VGTLLEVDRGRRKPRDLVDILAARHRSAAGSTAPPHGLMLMRVYYRANPRWRKPPEPAAPIDDVEA
jgi:tRNA pseudouridine38-40 synthase